MMVARRLGARYRRAGGGALHASDHQNQRDQELQHSFLKITKRGVHPAYFVVRRFLGDCSRGDRLCSIANEPYT
jgi:hypothetical protein